MLYYVLLFTAGVIVTSVVVVVLMFKSGMIQVNLPKSNVKPTKDKE